MLEPAGFRMFQMALNFCRAQVLVNQSILAIISLRQCMEGLAAFEHSFHLFLYICATRMRCAWCTTWNLDMLNPNLVRLH